MLIQVPGLSLSDTVVGGRLVRSSCPQLGFPALTAVGVFRYAEEVARMTAAPLPRVPRPPASASLIDLLNFRGLC